MICKECPHCYIDSSKEDEIARCKKMFGADVNIVYNADTYSWSCPLEENKPR